MLKLQLFSLYGKLCKLLLETSIDPKSPFKANIRGKKHETNYNLYLYREIIFKIYEFLMKFFIIFLIKKKV